MAHPEFGQAYLGSSSYNGRFEFMSAAAIRPTLSLQKTERRGWDTRCGIEGSIMSSGRPVGLKTVSDEIPAVPLTIEGYSVLHQMMRVRWTAWRQLAAADKSAIVDEAAGVLAAMERNSARAIRAVFLAGTQGRSDVRAFPAFV